MLREGVGQAAPGLQVSAPGKMMVVGEYAVLHGAPALVAAVDLRVRMGMRAKEGEAPAEVTPRPLPPEAAAAWRFAEDAYGPCADQVALDVTALRSGEQKLGVGSSAAAAAAAVAWVYAAAGNTLDDVQVTEELLPLALAGHRAVAPEGSGADVAASTLGGFVHVQREASGLLQARRLALPTAPVFRAVWTGKQVRTSEMLAAVGRLRERDPACVQACMAKLSAVAQRYIAAFEAGEVATVITETAAYHAAMAELGRLADVPIVEETLERIAQLASAAGGAAKPSGAGGGDVALAVFPDGEAAARFERCCADEDLPVLGLRFGAAGVRIDSNGKG